MKRLLLGSFLAALAVFAWGALFWYGPGTNQLFTEIHDQDALAEDLRAQLRSDGVYRLPWDPHDMKATQARHREGPIATIHFQRQGVETQGAGYFAGTLGLGFLHMLVAILLLAFALAAIAPGLTRYRDRARCVVLFALAASIFANLDQPIWWDQTWGFHLVHGLYDFGAWLIAGLILAAFVQPAEGETTPDGLESDAEGVPA